MYVYVVMNNVGYPDIQMYVERMERIARRLLVILASQRMC
jgi:hypothetical protein